MGRSTCKLSDIAWPNGKSFAFTIFDDTDGATVENTASDVRVLFALYDGLGTERIRSDGLTYGAGAAPRFGPRMPLRSISGI